MKSQGIAMVIESSDNIWTSFHGNPSSIVKISLKPLNVNVMVVQEEKSWDRQKH